MTNHSHTCVGFELWVLSLHNVNTFLQAMSWYITSARSVFILLVFICLHHASCNFYLLPNLYEQLTVFYSVVDVDTVTNQEQTQIEKQ